MDQYHKPHNKKVSGGTGGRRRKFRDKKLSHIGGSFISTRVADEVLQVTARLRGGKTRTKIKKASSVNVLCKDGKGKAVKIIKVLESHNPEYVRRNIITRGAVLETSLGKVRVTNRVGQDGLVNGVLV
ncbi:30S ribosomal protein S8e [Candidatus Micrarchaeota archaeon]|nr:30S ribosomal protein S8e [Candidatus Micrarchaeota archaeon]MBU1165390.1 30S ribosomal protein S8e [Candidatus Micrarchaeota archaeon]MBU1886211.1 30S ribosomal protein S8e [Candidatus Micrarchaeota archaeon]